MTARDPNGNASTASVMVTRAAMTTVRTMTRRQAALSTICLKLSTFHTWTTFVVNESTDQKAETKSTASAAT